MVKTKTYNDGLEVAALYHDRKADRECIKAVIALASPAPAEEK